MARDINGHRWSGWPGAFCLYCGTEDGDEIALADGVSVEDLLKKSYNTKCVASDERKKMVDDEMNPPKGNT